MKLLGKTVVMFAVATSAGCITFPQTLEEFRRDAAGSNEFSVDMSLTKAYELAAKNTIRCHQGDTDQVAMVAGSFFVFPRDSMRVEGQINESDGNAVISVQYFNPVGGGLLQVIDLERIGSNETRLAVRRLNDGKKWVTAAESVEGWFTGSTACYSRF